MVHSLANGILLIFSLILFTYCNQGINEEERMENQNIDYYTTKYQFANKPFYEFEVNESQADTLHRYYWELFKNEVDPLLDLFSSFDGESLSIQKKGSNYQYFGVIFNQTGQLVGEGFFDENLSFTGKYYMYTEEGYLFEKQMYKLGHRFYEVIYKYDKTGKIKDSTYQYYVIVIPDKDTFAGPDLNICFDIQLIIDRKKYNIEDFQLAYIFYDTKDIVEVQKIHPDNDKIIENSSRKSSDGVFHFCYDLELKHHLMMGFGIFVDESVSDQDLTFGEFHGPIINKNIDSTEL